MIEYFLIFSLFLFPAYAEPIPDYDKPYSPIFTDKPVYTWTDKIKMKIIAPSWNTDNHLIDSIGGDNDNPIKVSTREHSLKPYRFTETDVNSGIFSAEVILTGFLHDADGDGTVDTNPRTSGNGPTSGFLEVGRDSAVTISFEFADGVIVTESVPVRWNVGTIEFAEDHFLTDQTAQIRIIDQDMNLNPESLDHLPLLVSSDADVAGLEVDAIETSESSGVFAANIFFTQNTPSSGNRLFATPGNNIYAKYNDHTLPKPYTTSDHQEITDVAKLDSAVPATERINNSQILFSDSFGNQISEFSINKQMQIVGSISNAQDFAQEFVYIFQVRDSTNTVVSVSWIQGQVSPNQSLDVSQSWIPKTTGEHTVETFVWSSLSEPTALSPVNAAEIFVQ
ncbi:hypothetical protein NsoK4_07005 [Nitrosopumilus sp. K4]|uniref:hypothetical protein n=1 Tax=Nitrosopumilus sp. K4 TaxID=2795383 RepID=UPI001BAC0727|nr:hypothetical protein [Nitrosopumilus sp. K4]QUC64186.1 hypothetical protein NsoK4_07005 [Nitrosopumilus sp. K4]